MNNKSNIYDRKCIKLIYNRFFHLPRYNLRFDGYKQTRSRMISIELFERCPGVKICWETFAESFDYDHRTELSVQIRSEYFCIETCIGENINWKSYNRIIKLSTSYIIVKYIRGGLVLERFLPRGVEGADILFPRWKQTHVSKSAGNESGDIGARKEFWMSRHSANFFLLFWFFFDSWQDEVLNIAKIGLLNRTFDSKGQVLCLLRKMWLHVDMDRDRRNICNLTRADMIILRKVVYIFVLLKKKWITLCATSNTSRVKTNRDLFEATVAQINNKVATFLEERSTASSLLTVGGEKVFSFTHTTKNCSVKE